jgi:hypothetical protein
MRGTTADGISNAAHIASRRAFELRTMYTPTEIVASQLFRGIDADERLTEAADQWRLNLIAKGFEEIA